ncbi:MAG: dihydroneopterin triphosphate diphosphatase [Betaproteobacteria bacterium]
MSAEPTVAKPCKIPRSTLVVIYTSQHEVLLIERADHPGYWQSVTGSQDEGETLEQTAAREVHEETGIDVHEHDLDNWQKQNVYEIYAIWRHRYAPGVTHNTENVFGLRLSDRVPVTLDPREHVQHMWLPVDEAAARCFSWSNREAILDIPRRLALTTTP